MEKVRVLRLLEYEGPRDEIEETLRRRGVVGEVRTSSGYTIREAFVGAPFPFVTLPAIPKVDEDAKC